MRRKRPLFQAILGGEVTGHVRARTLRRGSLGRDIIHSVTNPIPRLTGAIHVYGGDFYSIERSEWDAEHLTQRPYDVQATVRLFEEANERFSARGPSGPGHHP